MRRVERPGTDKCKSVKRLLGNSQKIAFGQKGEDVIILRKLCTFVVTVTVTVVVITIEGAEKRRRNRSGSDVVNGSYGIGFGGVNKQQQQRTAITATRVQQW